MPQLSRSRARPLTHDVISTNAESIFYRECTENAKLPLLPFLFLNSVIDASPRS